MLSAQKMLNAISAINADSKRIIDIPWWFVLRDARLYDYNYISINRILNTPVLIKEYKICQTTKKVKKKMKKFLIAAIVVEYEGKLYQLYTTASSVVYKLTTALMDGTKYTEPIIFYKVAPTAKCCFTTVIDFKLA